MVERPEACFISGRKDLVEAGQYPGSRHCSDLIPYVRDIWNIPEYASLLNVLQTELNLAYVGRKPADEALNDAALAHQAIYDTIMANRAAPRGKAGTTGPLGVSRASPSRVKGRGRYDRALLSPERRDTPS